MLVTNDEIANAAVATAGSERQSTPTSSTAADAEHADLHAHIGKLQQTYADVFAEPSGLPPDRGIEHVIPLLPDAQPPF